MPSTSSGSTASENGKVAVPAAATTDKKVSGGDLKKQKQAEKAAKRAAAKSTPQTVPSSSQQQAPKQPSKQKAPQSPSTPNASAPRAAPATPSHQANQRNRRASTSKEKAPPTTEKKLKKEVALFGHLYGAPRRFGLDLTAKDVHPAVLALGLQISAYEICGSNARTVAMLLAFKNVIDSYTTPQGTSLARHLEKHVLSPQINYLKSCRPLCVSMGNSIRWLKKQIVTIDPSVPDEEAKPELLSAIDAFIKERVTAADELIAQTAASKIQDGDVILTYAKSSIVLKSILRAHQNGKRFRVIVVDSKPLFEGKFLARDIARAGVPTTYYTIVSAQHAVQEATKIFLGASAMMSNGRLYSRVGTAIVAMLAHGRDTPVIVCCESIKFSNKVALDSIVSNELAPVHELLGGVGAVQLHDYDGFPKKDGLLHKWSETPHLQMLNVMYDVSGHDSPKHSCALYVNVSV